MDQAGVTMPHFKVDFGSGFVDAKPLARNAANTGWQECEVYIRNDANTGWVLVSTAQITISPSFSELYANPGETITQTFTASGATSGSWSFASGGTGLTITNPNSLSCTVSGTRNANSAVSATLRFTASDGRTATATLKWSWGTAV